MLITEEYKQLNANLHHTRDDYGTSGAKWADLISDMMRHHKTLLDYGAGKCLLAKALDGFDVRSYDPCIEGLDGEPEPADLVYCGDVLEHVEPELLDNVLDHIQTLTKKTAILAIHTGPAGKVLADGRNAHLIQKPMSWWEDQIGKRFNIMNQFGDYEIVFVCGSKQ